LIPLLVKTTLHLLEYVVSRSITRFVTYDTLEERKMLGCFNPILGQTWTNPNVGLKF